MIGTFKKQLNEFTNVKTNFESNLRQFLIKNNNSIDINYTDNDDRFDCFYTNWNGDVCRSPITKIYLKGEDILLEVQDNIEDLYLFNGDVLTYETSMEILYYLVNLTPQNKETKVIKVTIGEMIDNGENGYQFKGGETDNGRCYKDMNAWETGIGFIYMSESEIDEVEEYGIENYSGQLWTRDTWCNWVHAELSYEEYGWEFSKHIAELILDECDWQDLETLFSEYSMHGTIESEYEEWVKNNKKD